MNQGPPDMYYPQHMSAGQATQPQTVTSGAMTHYPQPQPTLLQPGPQYSTGAPFSQYGYNTGLTSPPAAPPVSNAMGAQGSVLPLPGVTNQNTAMSTPYAGFDTTGQQPPPGMKPRVTATLWEDEGSLCFQVEARGICVARREDNHMINGTKLLNVAGMTRGRRDGILKSEKVRHVVKIGPMHLKGVWIPYDRALDFANKEKITELLYPLFVHNIGALLYHPTNQSRTSQVMAAAERRKQAEQRSTPGLPSIGHHHPLALPGPQSSLQSPLPSNIPRPPLDRAHTFPTPPTSASSVMGNMGASDSFNWQGQGMNGAQNANGIAIDTGINGTRSMPNTPATTPPGPPLQNMQSYPSNAQQNYDNSRQMYNNSSSQQSPYQAPNANSQDRMYAQNSSYAKNEMGPPASRPSAAGTAVEQPDAKPQNGIIQSEQTTQPAAGDEEGDHEHEAEYTHDSGSYESNRASYGYSTPAVGQLANENNIPAEMTGSPNHPPASGRATPRTTAPAQSYYPQHSGYTTSPRVQQTSSNLYNVMSNDRGSSNGGSGNEVYAPAADMSGSMANGYASQPPVINGSTGVLKRGRDEEDDMPRPASEGPGGMPNMDLKRRKTMMETSVAAPTYDAMNRSASAVGAPRRR